MNSGQLSSIPFGGFGGGVSESVFSPIALTFVLIAGILLLILPRKKAMVPFFLAALLIPTNQIIVVGGLHFPMLKVLGLFGMVRMLWARIKEKESVVSGGFNRLDMAMIALTASTAIAGLILWQAWGEVVFQGSQIYLLVGLYFLLRFLIRDEDDVIRSLRVYVWVTVLVAGVMVCEQLTGRNPVYDLLGGAQISGLTTEMLRGNGLRAAGTFAHPILAGMFGATSIPLFIGLWWKDKKYRTSAVVGIIAAIVIVVTSGSSTPTMALLAGFLALGLWPLRRQMRIIRWGIAGLIVSLHLVMHGPVWALINRMSIRGDSAADHRFRLVDECIRHFWDWAFIGTKDYGKWGWDMWDLSNQYVSTADQSGLIALISFIAVLVFAFKYIGRARRAAEGNKRQELFMWAMGAALFAHAVAFFGIGYWDQTIVLWYALLAMISTTIPAREAAVEYRTGATETANVTFSRALPSRSMRTRQSGVEDKIGYQKVKTLK